MNKVRMLRTLNPILFLSLMIQATTVCIIFFQIRTPYTQQVFEVHECNGMALIALAVAHITLNWGWIKVNYFKK